MRLGACETKHRYVAPDPYIVVLASARTLGLMTSPLVHAKPYFHRPQTSALFCPWLFEGKPTTPFFAFGGGCV